MPRLAIPRSVKSVQGRASKSNPLARAFTQYTTDAIDHGDSGKSNRVASGTLARDGPDGHPRVAVASNLYDAVGLHAFTLCPPAAENLEADDALLWPCI